MSIVEEVKKEIVEQTKTLSKDRDFVRLQDFYAEMKELGVAKSSSYDLPPLDTLGKNFFEIQHSADKKSFA